MGAAWYYARRRGLPPSRAGLSRAGPAAILCSPCPERHPRASAAATRFEHSMAIVTMPDLAERGVPGWITPPGGNFDLIGFDGDDTLWHNERLYRMGRDRFREVLA